MKKRTSIPQMIAWIIFAIENFLVINYGIQNLFSPKTGSAIPDTFTKVIIYTIVIGIAVGVQALTLVAIFKMNDSQGWLIVLAIMALLHDPFYFVPVIWTFVISKREAQKADL